MEIARKQKPLADRGIPLYRPDLSGNEKKYALDCIDSTWISSIGQYVGKFEEALARITGAPHAIVVCNGTVALHLAMHCLGIGPGDEVIVPTFTYIASVNAITQTGAKPIFAESRESDWLIDPTKIEALTTPRTKAILPVHLYGAVCDMPAIMEIARKRGLKIIEDCAESLGATLHGQHTGTFGDIGTFSFFGNKTITTGEGGAVIAADPALSHRLRIVKGQGQSLTRRYWHEELGFNYRMTNIAAAIGFAQSERLPEILAAKRRVAALKGFYIHLTAFVLVNIGLTAINIGTGSEWWVQWVWLGWGIGIIAHALAVFGRGSNIVSDWEKRKVRQLLEKK